MNHIDNSVDSIFFVTFPCDYSIFFLHMEQGRIHMPIFFLLSRPVVYIINTTQKFSHSIKKIVFIVVKHNYLSIHLKSVHNRILISVCCIFFFLALFPCFMTLLCSLLILGFSYTSIQRIRLPSK